MNFSFIVDIYFCILDDSKSKLCYNFQWEESEGLVEKKKANPNTRPLIIPNNRKRRRWSPEEEDTLRAGVQKCEHLCITYLSTTMVLHLLHIKKAWSESLLFEYAVDVESGLLVNYLV